MKSSRFLPLAFVASLIFSSYSLGDILIPNPVAGTGNYDLVPNGGFETGTVTMPWQEGILRRGDFFSSQEGFIGDFSAVAAPTRTASPIGFETSQTVGPFNVGETYVLSAYFNGDGLNDGSLYIDLNDINDDPTTGWHFGTDNDLDGWFFAYSEFVARSTSLRVRLVRDDYNSDFTRGGLIDEVAITPLADFVAPDAIPEPGSFVLLSLFAGLGAIRHRAKTAI